MYYGGSMAALERTSVTTHATQPHDAPVSSGSFFAQPRAVWAVAFACVIAFMGIGLVDPILKDIAVKLNATPSQVSLMFTSYMAIMGVAMLVTGVVSSRIGPKRTLLSGLVLIIIFAALAGSSGSVGAVVGFRAGWGLGNALFVATALATIVMSATGGTAQAIILFEAALGIGIASGPLVGGLLGEQSWRAPFFGVSVLMTIALVATAFFLPSTPPTGRRTSLADPFRALRHKPLLLTGLTGVFYNIGFFTILAAGPFALPDSGIIQIGWIYFGWGVLVAVVSVFVAPKVQRWVGTIPAVIGTLVLFMLDLLTMAVFADHQTVVIVGIVASGAFIGNNNTLITEAVMGVAPVERPVASAAYSFVRFSGGAIGPYVALKLFGLPPDIHVHAPFVFGAVMVAIGILIIASGAGVLTRALEGNHEARSAGHEAEAMLVGDLD
jgi:MFS family permease